MDMLVKLYDGLPPLEEAVKACEAQDVYIKRVIMPEMEKVCSWVCEKFGPRWEAECRGSFTNHPVSAYVAYNGKTIYGFACYNTTYHDFFGPAGVDETMRGKGIGKALLLSCLYDMKALGYAYAIIGGVGPSPFYDKVCHAIPIDGSSPGIYKNLI